MYTECKDYLVQALKDAGLKAPITSMKRLKTCSDIRLSAVLFQAEKLTKEKRKRIYQADGVTNKRRKYYARELVFRVVIGEANDAVAEEIYERLLVSLQDGVYVHGNYVEVIAEDTEWYAEEDSILRAKCAVELTIRFIGGVYRDYSMQPVGIAVETERSNDNENIERRGLADNRAAAGEV